MGSAEAAITVPLSANLHPRGLAVNGLVRQMGEPNGYAGRLDIHQMVEHDVHQQADATYADGRRASGGGNVVGPAPASGGIVRWPPCGWPLESRERPGLALGVLVGMAAAIAVAGALGGAAWCA